MGWVERQEDPIITMQLRKKEDSRYRTISRVLKRRESCAPTRSNGAHTREAHTPNAHTCMFGQAREA